MACPCSTKFFALKKGCLKNPKDMLEECSDTFRLEIEVFTKFHHISIYFIDFHDISIYFGFNSQTLALRRCGFRCFHATWPKHRQKQTHPLVQDLEDEQRTWLLQSVAPEPQQTPAISSIDLQVGHSSHVLVISCKYVLHCGAWNMFWTFCMCFSWNPELWEINRDQSPPSLTALRSVACSEVSLLEFHGV